MTESCICAICYEDVAPATDLLQTISVCGHVFHELCLQQWIEFCPNGRKPTCPLCKQGCAGKDVHRLYFQSSSEPQPKQDSDSSKSSSQDPKLSTADCLEVQKLQAKVRMLSTVCESSKQQISEFAGKESMFVEQLQSLETERIRIKKEKIVLADSLSRTKEELRKSSQLCNELAEKNKGMAKALAVQQLVTDVNLTEDDMLNLASVGRGTNKDDIIDMMTKSLHHRNRAFKELMAKCQALGMGESRAQHKCEKLSEQIKRLKLKLHELFKADEEKENAAVRSLTRPTKLSASVSPSQPGRDASVAPLRPLNGERKEARRKATANVISIHSDSDLGEVRFPGSELTKSGAGLETDMVLPAQNRRSNSPVQGNTLKKTDSVSERNTNMEVDQWTSWDEYGEIQNAPHSSFREDSLDDETWAFVAGNRSPHAPSLGARMQHLGTSKRVELNGQRSGEGCFENEGMLESQSLRPKIIIGVDGDIDNVEVLGRGAMLPIRQELGLGQGASYSRPLSLMGNQNWSANSESSKFIVSGADGRGGRITVLKPPKLVPGSSLSGANRSKRLKSSSQIAGSRPAALKIEHFFGRR